MGSKGWGDWGSGRNNQRGSAEAGADGDGGEFGDVAGAELTQEVGAMVVDGLDRDAQRGGDLLARLPLGQEAHQLALAGGQAIDALLFLAPAGFLDATAGVLGE